MRSTTLYLYRFDPQNFYLQDEIAGYYVSKQTQTPIGKIQIDDLFAELRKKNIEVRLVNNLWQLRDAVVNSTLNYSICGMRFAQPRE